MSRYEEACHALELGSGHAVRFCNEPRIEPLTLRRRLLPDRIARDGLGLSGRLLTTYGAAGCDQGNLQPERDSCRAKESFDLHPTNKTRTN